MTPSKQEAVERMRTNIPTELQALSQWLVWRIETRDNKPTKVPYSVKGYLASTTQPTTWASFDDACKAYLANEKMGYCGIGFVFTERDPYCGVDLDKQVVDGVIEGVHKWAIDLLDSYSEFSPSGTGVHIIVQGSVPGERHKNAKMGVEMYHAERYFTFTGNVLPQSPPDIRDCQEQLTALYNEVWPPDIPRTSQVYHNGSNHAAAPSSIGDEALWKKMFDSTSGAKIRRLHDGDTGGYPSRSEADMAMTNYLAWWTNQDRAQIDRMFRQTQLYREDGWGRKGYRETTIENAIKGCDGGYSPTGHGPDDSHVVGFHTTDLGNARRLVALHGQDLHYNYKWGKWFIWDGTRWAEDSSGAIDRKAKDVPRAMYAEAAKIIDDGLRQALVGWGRKTEARDRIRAMIDLARSEPGIPIEHTEFDADPYLLNCKNGVIDLKTGELLPHKREQLCTKRIDVEFNLQAACPKWESFLNDIMLADEEMIDFLHRWAGYSLTGDVSEQCLAFCYGTGANGKSTFLETMLTLLGNYAQKAPTEMIMLKFGAGGIPNDIARLRGARFVVTAELEGERRLAESIVKDLTGSDTLTARFLNQEFFEFKPSHKLWIYGNHKPIIKGTDDGIWRKIRLIPFEASYPEGDPRRNKNLDKELLDELPGILAWAVRGCLKWRSQGLATPEKVKEATNDYRSEMDVVGDFLDERCIIGEGISVLFADLYRAYGEYCDENHIRAENKVAFRGRLDKRGLRAIVKPGYPSTRVGIALKQGGGGITIKVRNTSG